MHETRPDDRGFTLVEVLVAMLILVSGAMAAAGLFHIAASSTRAALIETQTAVLAAAKMEQLLSLVWGYDEAGAPASDLDTDLSVEPVAGGGGGLRSSPVDTLDRNCPSYVDYLDARGRWVGTGAVPPAQAVYLRRWNIQPLAGFPADALVLRVRVTTVVQEALRIRSANPGHGFEASLEAVRMRLY